MAFPVRDMAGRDRLRGGPVRGFEPRRSAPADGGRQPCVPVRVHADLDPLFRAGLTFAAALPIILATDTVSIASMEVIDNAIVLLVPGAMEERPRPAAVGQHRARLRRRLPVRLVGQRYMLARGKGHALVHEYMH